MFVGFDVMYTVFFMLIIAAFVIIMVRGIGEWNKNNHSPRLTVPAKVVAKRINVTHHSYGNAGDASGAHGFSTTSSTRYYVTFQVESGDRIELAVDGYEYGMLIEGDMGKLRFQGTRYLGFDRENL